LITLVLGTGDYSAGGCFLLHTIYEGAPALKYYMGWREHIAQKTAYFVTLYHLGMNVVSGLETIQGDNSTSEPWKLVQEKYQKPLQDIISMGEDFIRMSHENMNAIVYFNAN
jgi:hypothetical protein